MGLEVLVQCEEIIQVMDIGAACIAEVPVYTRLLDRNLAHLNAFEGDSRHIEKIRQTYGRKVSIYNDFLGDGTEKTLYLASEDSGMTSLLKPNLKALRFFNGFENFGTVYKTESIQTRKLSDVADIPSIDLVKMDIQGSELGVLQHGGGVLEDCLAIQLEVSWICLYEGQPTFGDVDVWMRQNGYAPHCLLDVKKWSIAPTVAGSGDFRTPFNQLLESDIVYVRDPLKLEVLSDIQLKKLCLIAHYCFHSPDLCVHYIRELMARGVLPAQTQVRYYEQLHEFK